MMVQHMVKHQVMCMLLATLTLNEKLKMKKNCMDMKGAFEQPYFENVMA